MAKFNVFWKFSGGLEAKEWRKNIVLRKNFWLDFDLRYIFAQSHKIKFSRQNYRAENCSKFYRHFDFSFDTLQLKKIEHTLNDIYHVQSTFSQHSK